ncbi:UDP-N-acetyl-alpha-D-galactosamine polypeptide N-acetylgalactosaminyltransferase [Cichlidogyrus casuarinus]|uniref:UDP-N-acetyl-alpha-D-galactosamine polypeptide N-acetylgalactosaminyltransferase n=1 Tax=Cichlidogyrus casuarinus TaxID=1844966 RepID=A0ABD2PWM2_9PLAT
MSYVTAYPPAFLPSKVPPKEEPGSTALGAGGVGVRLIEWILSPKEAEEYKLKWDGIFYNQFLSDRISVRRYLPDNREAGCKVLEYNLKELEKTSVIVPFHNEPYTVILRLVHSLLDRSPPELLEEVILVDDASDWAQLHGKVRIVRLEKRSGLIQAKLKGADAARAPILTFLDAHTECFPGWLEPLLNEIKVDERTAISPVIVYVDGYTLQMKNWASNEIEWGTFTWDITSTIAGGMFSIHRNFFNELGRYDPKFEIWGGENLELSFKVSHASFSL